MALLVKFNSRFIRRPSIFVYNYAKQFASDYRDAFIETGKKMIEHPIKTIFYTSNIYLLFYAYHTMPTFNSYKNNLIEFRQQQLLTSSLIRNQSIELYMDTIEQLLAREQIHFVDCYLFSLIIYRSQHNTNENSYRFYENISSYLHLKRNSRIIDIGIFNRWFCLKRQMNKADIVDGINI